MPGVAVQPSSPGLGGFGASHASKWMSPIRNGGGQSTAMPSANTPNGTRSRDAMTVSEIKAKAKETVQKEGRGVSAMALIKTARAQIQNAKDYEAKGDLKSALGHYIKTASLMKMVIESAEFNDNKGHIRSEWSELIATDCKDLSPRTRSVEEKLKAIEKQAADTASQNDGPVFKAGGSIADRVQALKDNGLSVGSTKRFSREANNLPTPPTSPTRIATSTSSSIISNVVPPTPVSPSPHTLVSPSTLGPPSPSSSPSSSPQLDISTFSQTFPSIDELEGNPAFSLPSAPTGPINTEIHRPIPHNVAASGNPSPSPLTSFRNYAVHIERPSSTPIPPTASTFSSRPSSPNRSTAAAGPPLKSSGPPPSPKPPLPNTNAALPKDLLHYIRDYKVLLIDVRHREDFDREHIQHTAVICIEPSVLGREGVNADTLENSMVVGPKNEGGLFDNRDKFDLVALYDQSSTSFGDANSSLSVLVRIISETALKKILKRMPMMLVGGLDAWKRDLGGAGLARGESAPVDIPRHPGTNSVSPPEVMKTMSSSPSTSPNPNNPFHALLNSPTPGSSGGPATSGPSPYFPGLPPAGVSLDPHQVWNPRPRPDALPLNGNAKQEHRPSFSLDASLHTRSPADHSPSMQNGTNGLMRRPAMVRPSSGSISQTRSRPDLPTSPLASPQINGIPSGSITYPSFPRRISPTASGSAQQPISFSPPLQYDITSPPQASINPSQLSRRRSDYVDQSQEALYALQGARSPIDYPELSNGHAQIIRPPPAAAAAGLDRQDNRPRLQQVTSPFLPGMQAPKAPRINSEYPVTYWSDVQIGTSGLKNLGNTCYMNAPIQCLSATVPFARFFTEGRWKTAINFTNALGSQGKLVQAFAKLVHEMWGGDLPYLTPMDFRKSICHLNQQYIGSDQHDSQEFLNFLLDGIHEDLNRVMVKPPIVASPEQEAELERLPPLVASDREWRAWKARNDSLIVDFFQGQFRSRLECLTCHKTSTTYNVFSILQLPIPHSRSSKVPIQRCLDALFNEEVLEKDDAWDCPSCKTKRRASKTLSLARLPPILLIHLKRFEANGRFSDKIDTFVDFPMKSLDLTNYMPPPLPSGADQSEINGGVPWSPDDPRAQVPPYRYDLYGVTNHYGNLSSGHYTAYIASRGGWMLCDDSSVKPTDPKQVVNQKAYVLFYKRVRP